MKMSDEEYRIQIGKRIRMARSSAKMSLKELGLKVDKHESTLSKYESGSIKNISFQLITEIANILGVPETYLLCMDEEDTKEESNETIYYKKTITEELDKLTEGQLALVLQMIQQLSK